MPTQLPIPGFVDLQVNGYLGVDFSSPDLSKADLIRAWREILDAGTAAFLPTLITSPLEVYQRNLALIASVMKWDEFRGRVLGVHLEGPFISSQPGAVGAHNPDWTQPPDPAVLERIQDWAGGQIRLLTLAPELEGADRLAQYASARGVLVSLGHTLASADDLRRMHHCGAKALTHLGNGLPAVLPKFANPLWAGLADTGYTAMMIGDGHHIPARILRAMIHAKGVGQAVIVSDAAPVAGLPPGEYLTLGNRAVLEPSGRLHNPEKGHLVGSSYNLLRCMNVLAGLECFSLEEMVTLGFYNPLRLVNARIRQPWDGAGLDYDESSRLFTIRVM